MPADIYNIDELRERRLRNQARRAARPFWGADGQEIFTAFEKAMTPDSFEQRVLVLQLARKWQEIRDEHYARCPRCQTPHSHPHPPAA